MFVVLQADRDEVFYSNLFRRNPEFTMNALYKIFILTLLALCLAACNPKSSATGLAVYNAFLTLLGKTPDGGSSAINPIGSKRVLSFSPGESIDLNGGVQGSSSTGIIVDPSGNGSASGISINGNGVPQIIFVNNAQGEPYGVDVNGNGTVDYYLCAKDGGKVILTTGANCTGNQVIVYPGFGYDENGDGVIDNPILALIAGDSNPPISSIYPAPGIYGGAQTVTVTCADNLAPGNLVYSIDGSIPAFSPLVGYVKNPTTANFTVGSFGEGIYTVQYRCRDLAGNLETVQSAIYEVNHNLPNVTLDGGATSIYISGMNGAVNSISITWKSNQNGTFAVRTNGTGCSSGGILSSGSVSANASNTLTINANSLSVGTNSLYLCVTAGFTGQASFTVVRDDTAPTMTVDPGAGNYGKEENISLKCTDNSGAPCSVVAYTTDGSTPSVSGNLGTVLAGSAYSTPIQLIDGTLNRTIKYLARDKAGNLSSVQSATYSVDTSIPNINVVSTTPVPYSSYLVIDNVTSPQISWEVSGNKVSYFLKKKKNNACTQCSTPNVADCPVGKYKDTSGALYSNDGDCNCNNAIALIGSNTSASGTLAATNPISISSQIDNLNFALGQSKLLICVANAAANFGPQYASREISVWKDLDVPQATAVSPTINSHNVKPDPGKIVITFSEPMQDIVPTLKVQYFNGSSWTNFTFDTDYKPNFAWNIQPGDPHNILTITLPWTRFPENAYLRWEIDRTTLKDISSNSVQSNDASGQLAGTFLTGSYFSTLDVSFMSKLLKTGQKRCMNQSGWIDESDCKNNNTGFPDGTERKGQDGYFQFGSGFVNSDATNASYPTETATKDETTSLIWQNNYTGGNYTFSDALKYCSSLNRILSTPDPLGPTHGYSNRSNWRLPSVEELETVLGYEGSHNITFSGACSSAGIEMDFWSSSFFTPNLTNSWYVDFCKRNVYFDTTATAKKARCVSGSIPSSTVTP